MIKYRSFFFIGAIVLIFGGFATLVFTPAHNPMGMFLKILTGAGVLSGIIAMKEPTGE